MKNEIKKHKNEHEKTIQNFKNENIKIKEDLVLIKKKLKLI